MKNKKLLPLFIAILSVLISKPLIADQNFLDMSQEIGEILAESVTRENDYTKEELIDMLVEQGVRENLIISKDTLRTSKLINDILIQHVDKHPDKGFISYQAIYSLIFDYDDVDSAMWIYRFTSSYMPPSSTKTYSKTRLVEELFLKKSNKDYFLEVLRVLIDKIDDKEILSLYAFSIWKSYKKEVDRTYCSEFFNYENNQILKGMEMIMDKYKEAYNPDYDCLRSGFLSDDPGNTILKSWANEYAANKDSFEKCDYYLKFAQRLIDRWKYRPDKNVQNIISQANPSRKVKKMFKL